MAEGEAWRSMIRSRLRDRDAQGSFFCSCRSHCCCIYHSCSNDELTISNDKHQHQRSVDGARRARGLQDPRAAGHAHYRGSSGGLGDLYLLRITSTTNNNKRKTRSFMPTSWLSVYHSKHGIYCSSVCLYSPDRWGRTSLWMRCRARSDHSARCLTMFVVVVVVVTSEGPS